MKTRYLRAENDRVCFNQSLRLTEPTVDDLAWRNNQLLLDWTYHVRTGYRSYAASPPQLSSGPLGGKNN
jgi:hypothetical protein